MILSGCRWSVGLFYLGKKMFSIRHTIYLISSVCLLSACAEQQQTTSEPAPTQTINAPRNQTAKQESYVVVSQSSYPPFATRDETGKMVGLDMDILNAIAEKQGFTLKFIPHDMDGLLESLNEDGADIVATGVNITPERQKKYDFSQPYLEASWVALVNKDKVKAHQWSDLKNKKFVVQSSSLSETQLKNTAISADVLPLKTVYLGVAAVGKGDADAIYDVDSVLDTYLKPNTPFIKIVDEESGRIPFGFVFKKGNLPLKTKIDQGLEKIKADGTYQKILDKWYPKN